MSVINKVLKDLDKQKQAPTSSNTTESDSGFVKPEVQFTSQVQSDSSDEQSSRKGVYMSIAMFVAIIIFGLMFYRQGMKLKELQPLLEVKQTQQLPVVVEGEANKTQSVEVISLETKDAVVIVSAEATTDTIAEETNALEVSREVSTSKNASGIILAQSEAEIIDDSTDSVIESKEVLTNAGTIESTEVIKIDSKMASITEANSLKPAKVESNSSTVKVRFSQNTRTSAIVEDIKTDVTNNPAVKQPSSVNKAEQNELVISKGVMAVKEVTLTNAELAQKKFDIAEVAEQQQKVDKAVKYYYEALLLEPAMHQARKQLASLYYALNNLGRAEQILAQGVAQFPEEVELAILKAKVENASFSPVKALSTLEGISDKSDWARDKWVLQSDIAQKNGNFELAESAYRSLITIEPSQARWWMGLAYALDSQQQYPQAADAYRKAMSYRGLSTGAMTYIEQRLIQLGGSQ